MAALTEPSRVGSKSNRAERKKLVSSIKQKAKDVLGSKENSNNIVEILEYLQHDEKDIVNAAIQSTSRIFCHLLAEDEMIPAPGVSGSKEKYRLWLQARYNDAIRCLCNVVGTFVTVPVLQELALRTLMKFVAEESKHPFKKEGSSSNYFFPIHIIALLVPQLLSKTVVFSELIGRCKEYMEYDDVRYHVLQHVQHRISKQAKEKLNPMEMTTLCNNTVNLLHTVTMPTDEESINNFLGMIPDPDEGGKIMNLKEHRRVFTNAWLAFLRFPLPNSVYKQILINIHENVMPHMTTPLHLTDFLTASYDIGGAISLLALNGLFILINQYNLEYPDFFTKLYAMFEPSLFHVKYKARFFHLADMFLSSTHLPSYVVAAFAKRLSRLSLTAPPHALMMLIPFVCNLLMRHPNCKVLVHRPHGPRELSDDPYKMDEPNPAKCNALESSLWEIQTLKSHYDPGVSRSAANIEKPFPKVEWDLDLDLTIPQMVAKETKKKMKTMPLEFEPAKGLLGGGGQDMFDARFWVV
ncbi:nucleolar complex protein 4 homolog isoform X1 [Strongylocentrotus purpuratus]|uniref:CCAAT-binding factor domain-containing protein n=1 Tax=Strongylocentrotus purpuratus TaxID=7668 RepID=A0A7M7PF10_STRPU|nr:nucleolar complex protein 4 homolog isoform X1 [Strongylocentrotus purpuratus]